MKEDRLDKGERWKCAKKAERTSTDDGAGFLPVAVAAGIPSPVAIATRVTSPVAVAARVTSPVAVAARVASPVAVAARIACNFRLDNLRDIKQ